MFVIEYHLHVGASRHYAPSAMAAVRLAKDIQDGGGTILNITRTRDSQRLTLEELGKIAENEVGPEDIRTYSLWDRLRRLLKLDRWR